MPFLDAPGARVHYHVCGSGPTLVFVHGAGANGLVFFQQAAHFSRRYRVICMDMRGFGMSACDAASFHPRQFSSDLALLLDREADGEAVAVVCQSMGAWAGLPLAVREPHRFRALVLSGSPTPAYGPHHAVLQVVAERFSRVLAGERVAPEALGFSEEFVRKRADLLTLYQMLAKVNQRVDLSTIVDPELRLMPDDLAGFAVPTLVMGGSQNKLLGSETHLVAASLIPGARSYTFTQSGHSSYYEEPDHYNRVVESFFADCGYAGATTDSKPC